MLNGRNQNPDIIEIIPFGYQDNLRPLRLLYQTQRGHRDRRPGRIGSEGLLDLPAAVVDAGSVAILNGPDFIDDLGEMILNQPVIIDLTQF